MRIVVNGAGTLVQVSGSGHSGVEKSCHLSRLGRCVAHANDPAGSEHGAEPSFRVPCSAAIDGWEHRCFRSWPRCDVEVRLRIGGIAGNHAESDRPPRFRPHIRIQYDQGADIEVVGPDANW